MSRRSRHYWHWPLTQTWDGSHWVPQVPQLLPSASRVAQVPAQSVVPAGHVQSPAWQIALPAQTARHSPQCALSVDRSAHVLAQVAKPDVHWTTQAPALQRGVAAGHTFPQAPQFVRLVRVSTQLPSPPNPPAHCV